jgi:ribosomal protein S18 acetylase RimI-like enzyme
MFVSSSGLWFGIALCGKYLEIDNFIVHPEHRKKGIGKIMTDYVDAKAKELGCTMIVLDALQEITLPIALLQPRIYTQRFSLLKILDENGLSYCILIPFKN